MACSEKGEEGRLIEVYLSNEHPGAYSIVYALEWALTYGGADIIFSILQWIHMWKIQDFGICYYLQPIFMRQVKVSWDKFGQIRENKFLFWPPKMSIREN